MLQLCEVTVKDIDLGWCVPSSYQDMTHTDSVLLNFYSLSSCRYLQSMSEQNDLCSQSTFPA